MPRMPVARRMVMGRSFVPGPLGVLKVLFAVVYRRDMRPSYVPSMSYGGPHVCPRCGERVSAFAAGCALCGADLDPRRAQGPRSIVEKVRFMLKPRSRPRDPVR